MRIDPPDKWPSEKLSGLQNFLDPNDPGAAEMPVVGVWDAPRPGWWSRVRKHRWPAVAFTNGRHRAHLLRHFGAATIPVEVSKHSVKRVLDLCGGVSASTEGGSENAQR